MAAFFLAVGVIIMVLSGGCSLVFIFISDIGGIGGAIFLFGGVPFAIGLVMFLLAKQAVDKKRSDK